MTATSATGYTPANQDLAKGRSIIPIQVLIVAELSTCIKTIHTLLELQDLGCIQILGRVENGVDALQAMTVLLPDLIILDDRQGISYVPLNPVLANKFPVIKQHWFAEEDCTRLRDISLTLGLQLNLS